LYDSYGTTGGGEFRGEIVGTDHFHFISFSLETNEFFTLGEDLLVTDISTEARMGGAGGPDPDPVSYSTAYLLSRQVPTPHWQLSNSRPRIRVPTRWPSGSYSLSACSTRPFATASHFQGFKQVIESRRGVRSFFNSFKSPDTNFPRIIYS